jgi:hypothetical protein
VRAFSETQKDRVGSFWIVNDQDHFASWVESYFRDRGNELRKIRSKQQSGFGSSTPFARLGDPPLCPHSNRSADMRDRSSVPFSASCTAINDEIGTTSTW